MKHIVVILILVFSSKVLFSQTEKWFTKDLDKYVGTWVCSSSNKEFKIVLKKGYCKLLREHECLLGGYYYKTDILVVDFLQVPYSVANFNNLLYIPIFASNAASKYENIDSNELLLLFRDFKLKKISSSSLITLLSPTSIRWQLIEDEGDYVDNMPPAGFSVPTDAILTKVQ